MPGSNRSPRFFSLSGRRHGSSGVQGPIDRDKRDFYGQPVTKFGGLSGVCRGTDNTLTSLCVLRAVETFLSRRFLPRRARNIENIFRSTLLSIVAAFSPAHRMRGCTPSNKNSPTRSCEFRLFASEGFFDTGNSPCEARIISLQPGGEKSRAN